MDKLTELGKKIEAMQHNSKKKPIQPAANSEGAWVVASELIGGVTIGGLLGYYLDDYFHTKPLFLLILLILGLISSLYTIYKKGK